MRISDWSSDVCSSDLGLLTGEPGVGKTAALRHLTCDLNPHRHRVIYLAETDFGRTDLYRGLARALGVGAAYRRAQLWSDIKNRIHELVDGKQLTTGWIIDEAQKPNGKELRRARESTRG